MKERHRNANKDRSAFAAEAFKTGFSILEFLSVQLIEIKAIINIVL